MSVLSKNYANYICRLPPEWTAQLDSAAFKSSMKLKFSSFPSLIIQPRRLLTFSPVRLLKSEENRSGNFSMVSSTHLGLDGLA